MSTVHGWMSSSFISFIWYADDRERRHIRKIGKENALDDIDGSKVIKHDNWTGVDTETIEANKVNIKDIFCPK